MGDGFKHMVIRQQCRQPAILRLLTAAAATIALVLIASGVNWSRPSVGNGGGSNATILAVSSGDISVTSPISVRRPSAHAPWASALALSITGAEARRNTIEAFVPIKRRGLLVGCAGVTITQDNPLGLRDRQWRSTEDAQAFYRAHYDRAEALGIDRVVWHMPAGFQLSGMHGRFAVLTVMGDRGPLFVSETQRFLTRNPGASIGVYISAFLPRTIYSWNDADILPCELYNGTNRHRRMVDNTMAPLRLAGVSEVWLDNSAPAEYRPQMLALVSYLRAKFGMYPVFEGVPNIRQRGTTQRLLDMSVLADFAGAGIHRLIQTRDPGDIWQIGEQTEVIAALSDHDIHRNGGSTPPTPEEVQSYIDRGFTLFSFDEEYDEYLLW